MSSDKQKKVEQALQTIALQEGIPKDNIREEIALAISIALKDERPEIHEFWKKIPCESDSPTIEEIIDYIIVELAKKWQD